MPQQRIVYAILASVLLFALGVAVGQQQTASRFSKYRVSATQLDLMALEANIGVVRGSLPLENGISVPQIFYDYTHNRFKAWSYISDNFEKATLDTVKMRLSVQFLFALHEIKSVFAEATDDDLVFEVVRLTADPNKKLYAEVKKGSVVLH